MALLGSCAPSRTIAVSTSSFKCRFTRFRFPFHRKSLMEGARSSDCWHFKAFLLNLSLQICASIFNMLHIANLTLPRMIWEMSTTPPSLWSLDMFWLLWSRIGPYVTSHSILIGLHLLLSSLGSNIVLRIACCVVGIGLPVYTTFKAIEKKDLEDQEQCLVYWAVYGCFNIVEVFSDMLISWFPLYYHAKLAFLIWLQIPSTFGSRNIYMRYLRPFLQIHQTRLDRIVGRAYNEINNIVVTHQREIQFVRIPIQKMVMAVYHIIKDIIQSSQPWRDGTVDDAADRTIERTTSDAD